MATLASTRSALRRPLPGDARLLVCGAAGVALFLLVLSTAWLALVNLSGPFEEATGPGAGLALLTAGLGGTATSLLVDRLGRRSGAAAVTLLLAILAAGAVLLPRPIDQHESFLPQPNERYACTGWSFAHYPPGVLDGTGTTYCVGLERRLRDG